MSGDDFNQSLLNMTSSCGVGGGNMTCEVEVKYRYVKAVTISTVTLAIYVINSLSIYLLYKTRSSQHWQNTVVVLCIFTGDLLNGMTTYSISTLKALNPSLLNLPHLAEVHLFFWFFWGTFSIWTLAGASIVQLMAIVRALEFDLEVTRKKIALGMLLICTLAACYALYGVTAAEGIVTITWTFLPYWGDDSLDVTLVGGALFLLGTIVIIVCYARIFLEVMKQRRQIATIDGNQGDTTLLGAISSAKKLFVITSMYLLAHAPLSCFSLAGLPRDTLVFFFISWLYVCNSFFNSLVYVLVNRSARKLLAGMLFNNC